MNLSYLVRSSLLAHAAANPLLPYLRGGAASFTTTPSFITEVPPAPGTPFHYAFPVHDLQLAKDFYGGVLGCAEGRSSEKWQDYSLHGHQIVAHWVGKYKGLRIYICIHEPPNIFP